MVIQGGIASRVARDAEPPNALLLHGTCNSIATDRGRQQLYWTGQAQWCALVPNHAHESGRNALLAR
jgi:hypothetical protein